MTDGAESMRDRLARLVGHSSSEILGHRDGKSSVDAQPIIGPESVEAVEEISNRGRYWRRSTVYDPNDPWGETCLTGIVDIPLSATVRIPFDGSGERIPVRNCLFVDCETTGLSGGTGIVSFLTAVGQLTEQGFVVDQYFLPDLADEAGKLDVLAERFANAAALVSYNGASFDLPLLEGRFQFWRIDPDFRSLPHLDLLWPTRATFRQRILECTLSNVEMRLLRFARVEDLPGSEAPEVYFQYLREGTSPRLHAVFEHNRMDVVSLFVYALWLNSQTDPLQPALSDPGDLMALARYWFRRRMPEAALTALDAAATRVLGKSQQSEMAELRGRVLKRERRFDAAHAEWTQVVHHDPRRVDAAEELAKHYEHRRRDYTGALEIVDKAIERIRVHEALGERPSPDERKRLMHRRDRLLRRIAAGATQKKKRRA